MSASQLTRVALFLDASAIGGIEQHVATLAQSLAQSGRVEPLIILWRDYGNKALSVRLQQTGTTVECAHGRIKRLDSILRKHAIRVLHTHGYKANLIGRLFRIWRSLRVIATHHNGDPGRGRVRLYTLLDQLSAGLSENWAVSRDIQARLRVPSRWMPNFIDLPEAHSLYGNDVVFVGRFQTEKRPDRFADIARRCPSLAFCAFGEGPLYDEISSQKPSNLSLPGFQSDPKVLWRQASVCIICSDFEGLPLAALEAMSRGVPVIAWPLGQLPELIDDRRNGWVVHSEEECAAVLQDWFAKSCQAQQLVRQAARKRIQQTFSAQACLPKYVECYLDHAKSALGEY